MAATTDCWLADRNGDAVLVWSSPPGKAFTGELKTATTKVRELLGADAKPTVCFDRGGWSPKVFAELVDAGFDSCTCRRGPFTPEACRAFSAHEVTDRLAHSHVYLLADRTVWVYYDRRRRYFACRQVTRLDPATGHQTQILTTRTDLSAPEVAQTMFGRWREENLFRFMRPRGLEAMDSYAKSPDDPTRMVPNPATARMAKQLCFTCWANSMIVRASFRRAALSDPGKASSTNRTRRCFVLATFPYRPAATRCPGARRYSSAKPWRAISCTSVALPVTRMFPSTWPLRATTAVATSP